MEIRARIAALVAAEPALADELTLRGALIEIVDRAEVSPGNVRLPGDLARARLAAGAPLLDGLNLPIPPAVTHLFERLTVAMLADPANRLPAEALLAAAQSHRLHAEQVVGEAVVGHDEHLDALATGAGVPTPLISSLADLAARPLLAALAQRLEPALTLGAWTRGYCPVCGARPIFAETDQLESSGVPGDVRLRCGRCVTGWVWNVRWCPGCSEGLLTMRDTVALPEFGEWRLGSCNQCHGYLKIAAGPRSDRLADLLLDDLATWRLDQAALSHGLRHPTTPGYRLEHGDIAAEEPDDD